MKNMKKHLTFIRSIQYKTFMSLIILSALIHSCTNEFDFLSNNKPSWLGESIYEQLQTGYVGEDGTAHTFNTFLKLIDDIGYAEVLKKTGSKTLFVSDDEAFERFYNSNNWGVKSYEEFTLAQKKLILNSSMINNAYLVELLSNTEGPVEGQALRRTTAVSYIDSLNFENANLLPVNNKNWDFYREKGLYLLKDNTPIPMLHFLQRQMNFKGMTNEDFAVIFNGKTREKDDAHIYGIKIIKRDITCKNGYINILEDVLIPPANMAEIIRTSPETQLFSNILERFSAPYYSEAATNAYKTLHPDFSDSIFVKRYFSERSSTIVPNINNPKGITQAGYLEFDPGWNTYNLNNQMQTDMAAIFVPTNETMTNFFNNGGGKFLIEKFKTIDSIPNDVLDDLLRNHMKSSFLGTLPGRFNEVMDDGKEPMGISKSDVVKTYVGNNGVIYVTNKIYAPASYVAVTAPVLIHDNTKIFNQAIKHKDLRFDAYLLSMDSHYSFLVPLDIPNPEALMGDGFYYIDPVSYAKTNAEIFKLRFKAPDLITGTAYKYTPSTGEIGDSVRVVPIAEIIDRMEDILDYHIVVGDIQSGKKFYRTKGGGQIKIEQNGTIKMQGGGNIEIGKKAEVKRIYDQTKATNGRGNGKTFLMDAPLLPPYRSVYKILSEEPQFSEFFRLLQGNDEAGASDLYDIFYTDKKYAGMDFNVKFFNTYHYSVYVPTNEAIQAAVAKGLPTWEIIKQETDQSLKDSLSSLLVNFLKYHFQDNSIYVDGSNTGTITYETAAYTLSGKKAYYKLGTKLTGDNLTLYTNANTTTTVRKADGLYNIMARDYKFNNADLQKATAIETSSWAVIHQINDVLVYDSSIMNKMRQLTNKSKAKRKTVTTHRTVK